VCPSFSWSRRLFRWFDVPAFELLSSEAGVGLPDGGIIEDGASLEPVLSVEDATGNGLAAVAAA
jgi:hypothetical protein